MARYGIALMGSRRRTEDLGAQDWYRRPSWYDILHAAGTALDVDGLEEIAARYVHLPIRGGMRWLEPACGTARHLRLIASRGGRVWGFDREPSMIDYAQHAMTGRGLRGTLFEADMADFRLPRTGGGNPVTVHLAFNLISSIRHLRTDDAMLAHFRCMADAVARGGVYAVGIGMTAYGAEMPSEDLWEGRRGPCTVTQVVQYLPAERRRRLEQVISHLRIRTPTTERHLDTSYELRAYSGRQWATLLEKTAFEVVDVVDEHGDPLPPPGDVGWEQDGSSGYGIWVLRRR
ncbi:MAG: class I SAM-dependent methyltransferase [Planctomycetota bacterium]